MSYEVNDIEYVNVISLEAPKKYVYFVKIVCDWEEIWSIGDDDGWVLMGDNEGHVCVPVWPAERYAQEFCIRDWQTQRPKVINLDDWIHNWIPGICEDNKNIAVFPTLGDYKEKGIVVTPQKFSESIEIELEKYE